MPPCHTSQYYSRPAKSSFSPTLPYVVKGARRLALAALLLLSFNLFAAETNRGPDVVIIAGEDKVVYEFRQNGLLRMVRVEPKWGKPYYLVPRDSTKGFGDLERADMLVPQWVIAEF